MLQAQVFTLYPEIFPGPLDKGLFGKAMAKKLWSLNVINIRDVAKDKHKTVDDAPYGGGTGMLMKPDVLANSIDQNVKKGNRILICGFGLGASWSSTVITISKKLMDNVR